MEGKYQKIGPTIHRSVSQVKNLEGSLKKLILVFDLENLENFRDQMVFGLCLEFCIQIKNLNSA